MSEGAWITKAQGYAHGVTAEDTELAISKSLSNTSVIGTEGMFHLTSCPLKEYYPTHRGAI
jgi:hypothetical protein